MYVLVILTMGQANVSLTYVRQLGILVRLTDDMKKAKKLLNKHESSLSRSLISYGGLRSEFGNFISARSAHIEILNFMRKLK